LMSGVSATLPAHTHNIYKLLNYIKRKAMNKLNSTNKKK
jgi:hypothetical protein